MLAWLLSTDNFCVVSFSLQCSRKHDGLSCAQIDGQEPRNKHDSIRYGLTKKREGLFAVTDVCLMLSETMGEGFDTENQTMEARY